MQFSAVAVDELYKQKISAAANYLDRWPFIPRRNCKGAVTVKLPEWEEGYR